MKHLLTFCCLGLLVFTATAPAAAQDKNPKKKKTPSAAPAPAAIEGPKQVATISQSGDPALDKAIADIYEVISGPAGQPRDWERFKAQFADNGGMGVVFRNKQGVESYMPLSADDYIATSGRYIEEKGFFEREINRKVERYGQLVSVFSTYEARETATDPRPMMRGINSIVLVKTGTEYKIVSLVWQQETPQLPLPEQYLPEQKR